MSMQVWKFVWRFKMVKLSHKVAQAQFKHICTSQSTKHQFFRTVVFYTKCRVVLLHFLLQHKNCSSERSWTWAPESQSTVDIWRWKKQTKKKKKHTFTWFPRRYSAITNKTKETVGCCIPQSKGQQGGWKKLLAVSKQRWCLKGCP